MLRPSGYLITVLFASLIFLSCSKGKVRWLYYDETRCADRWEYNINNEVLKENIITYMQKQGVSIYEIEIFHNGVADLCADCTCKTGRVYKCKVKKGDVKAARSAGFRED